MRASNSPHAALRFGQSRMPEWSPEASKKWLLDVLRRSPGCPEAPLQPGHENARGRNRNHPAPGQACGGRLPRELLS